MEGSKKNEGQKRKQIENIIDILLTDNSMSSDDLREIQRWLADDRYGDIKSEELSKKFFEEFKYEEHPKIAYEMWPALADRLGMRRDLLRRPSVVKGNRGRMAFRKRTAFKFAAVLLPFLILGASLALWVNKTGDTTKGFATVTETPTVSITADIARELKLPDGSTIDLKPGSVVSYPEDFDNDREVFLDGEAFFSVTHIDGRPFRVHSNSLTVTVYGTEFNVKAYDDDDTAEVKLASGSVAVSGEGLDETFILPGQRIVFDKTENTITLDEIGEGELSRLRGLSLSMEGQTLDEAFGLISQYFGVTVRASGKLDLRERVNVNFEDDVTLEEALSLLGIITSTPFDYSIGPDTVRITGIP